MQLRNFLVCNKIIIKLILDSEKFDNIKDTRKCVDFVQIRTNISTIHESMFRGFTSLLEIEIPHTVGALKDSCFSGCSSLKKVTIPSSVNEIEEHSFERCLSLTEIAFPSSLISLKSSVCHS